MLKLTDLLAMRICDLKLSFRKSHLYSCALQLYQELKNRHLLMRPECYFADEWFVPEGDPVIGVPFYLGTPDLIRLEKKMMGEVEGQSRSYFMKLLRHEAGHAVCYAFRLHRKKSYSTVFGKSSKLFSEIYRYHPKSKKHVVHLNDFYAQSHPDEDFAETFAVWLTHPPHHWKKRYKKWKALKKLMYVDMLMNEIQHKEPLVKGGEKMCHTSTLKYTLWTYYMRRRSFIQHHSRVNK